MGLLQLKAWIEQKTDPPSSKIFLQPTASSLELHLQHWHLLPDSLELEIQLSLGPPDFELTGFYDHMSQFLIMNDSINQSIFLLLILFFWRTLTNTPVNLTGTGKCAIISLNHQCGRESRRRERIPLEEDTNSWGKSHEVRVKLFFINFICPIILSRVTVLENPITLNMLLSLTPASFQRDFLHCITRSQWGTINH